MKRYLVSCIVIAGCSCAASGGADLPAAQDLAAVQSAALQRAAALESRCQTMVDAQAGPEQLGPMYFKAAEAYLKCGKRSAVKVAEYCEKALACPQPVLEKVRLLNWWGYAAADSPTADAVQATANRRQAVTRYLQALNVVVANQATTRPQPIPRSEPQREQVLLQNNLVAFHEGLVQDIVDAYRIEGSRAELAELTGSVLKSSVVANEVLSCYDKVAAQKQ